MTKQPKYCEFCSAPLAADANFCEACGQKVRKPEPAAPPPAPALEPPPANDLALLASPPEPAPAPKPPAAAPYKSMTADEIEAAFAAPPPPTTPPQAYPPPPPAAPQGKSKLPIILGALGCLTILCVVAVIIGVVLFFRSSSTKSSTPARATQIVVAPPAKPTRIPSATVAPAFTEPTPVAQQPSVNPTTGGDAWSSSIGQSISDTAFSDDFSSDKFEWASVDDDVRFWGIQNERYTLHLKVPDYTIWAYLPVDFTPNTIGFDAAVQNGFEQGAYGVLCHYQDVDNYHFVSLDPYNNEYSIGYLKDNEYFSLLEDMWLPAQHLKTGVNAINHIEVVCDLDMITLFVNNELEATTGTQNAIAGDTAIYGETWEETPSAGFKVLIDNLYAYKPVQ